MNRPRPSLLRKWLQQHPDLCAIVGVWDNTDIGTAAALDEAGLSDQVFLSTSGGGGELSCKGIREDMWDHYVSYDVPGQGRDLNALISSALQSTTEVGSIKTVLYTPLIEYTAENVDQQSCWTLDSIR